MFMSLDSSSIRFAHSESLETLDLPTNKNGCSSAKENGNHERIPQGGTSRMELIRNGRQNCDCGKLLENVK